MKHTGYGLKLLTGGLLLLMGIPALSVVAGTLELNNANKSIVLAAPSSQNITATPGGSLFLPAGEEVSGQGGTLPEGVLRTRPVQINAGVLPSDNGSLSSTTLETISFNLFPGMTITGEKIRTEAGEILPDSYIWVGTVAGDEYGQVILSVSGGQVEGFVRTGGAFYEITAAANGNHEINQIDPLTQVSTLNDSIVPSFIPPGTDSGGQGDVSGQAEAVSFVDLMVVYTAAARAAQGGTTAMQNAIQAAVASVNQSYFNSGVQIRMRLVRTEEVAYTETGDTYTDLQRVQADDGFIDSVLDSRDTYNADIVSFITNTGTTGVCGLGYQMAPPFVSSVFAEAAYHVVVLNCLAGGLTLAHEAGHNMGAQHDAANAQSPGAYSYSYGYRDPGGYFSDIMSYYNGCPDPCTPINYFSNRTKTLNSRVMGNNSADNAATLNGTRGIVAGFQNGGQTLVTLTPSAIPVAATSTPAANPTALPTTCNFSIPAGDKTAFVNAINSANGNGVGNDVICLAPNSTYTFTSGITTPNDGVVALPIIRTSITILGRGATLTRSGSVQLRFFLVNGSTGQGALYLDNIRLNNGRTVNLSISRGYSGGAITNQNGILTITGSTFNGNSSIFGGAIYSYGRLTIADSTFVGNSARYGGAVSVAGDGGTVVTIQRSYFRENMGEEGSAVLGAGVSGNATDITLLGNCFVRNTNYSVGIDSVDTNANITAESNWWNSSSGPSLSNGSVIGGDLLVVGELDYTPFLTYPPIMCDLSAPPSPTPAPQIVLNAPASGAQVNERPVFSWGALAGAQSYELQLSDSNPPTQTAYVGSVTTFQPGVGLLPGNYSWRVRAVFVGGGTSPWSQINLLSVVTAAGAAPARNYYTSGSVTLTWARVSYASGYEVQVARNNTFTTVVYSDNALEITDLSATTTLGDGGYFWRVRAMKPDGTPGPWSAVESFIVNTP